MAVESREARPRVALVSLGCRVNRSDLDALASALRGEFALAAEGEQADYVVVNTCTVTRDAESTARQAIRRAAREHPGARIVAAGCGAELGPDDLAALPGVAAVVGARSHPAIPGLLRRLQRGEAAGAALAEARVSAPTWISAPPDPAGHTRAFLKVQDGCDARCSFCIVPAARGPARSLPLEEALARVAALGERCAEVVLTGVRLGGYGRDLSPRSSLEDLLRAAAARRLVRRLRLSSIEPLEFADAFLDRAIADVLCPHFHLPLQSGSGRILGAMRRPYRAADYARVVERIGRGSPGACLGADVMVGFPGESDADHLETVRLVESLPLAYLHVFTFSPRPGTVAAALPGAVHPDAARARARDLLALSEMRWRAYLDRQLGRVVEVIVERVESGIARGTAREYFGARWPAGRGLERGAVARVRVERHDGSECFGTFQ